MRNHPDVSTPPAHERRISSTAGPPPHWALGRKFRPRNAARLVLEASARGALQEKGKVQEKVKVLQRFSKSFPLICVTVEEFH